MKILHINAVSNYGSTGSICKEISSFLEEKGHTSYIAYSYGIQIKNSYLIGSRFSVLVHSLLARITGLQSYYSIRETKKLLKYIKKINPHIVHLHNLHANYINLNLLISFLSSNDIATVVSLHDCWFYTGKCTHYTTANCYKWKINCGNCPKLKNDIPSWIFDFTSKMLTDKKKLFNSIPRLAVIGVSDWITNEASHSHFKDSAQILKRIYNWVDLTVFKPIDSLSVKYKLGLNNKFIILGVASSWTENKGLLKFLELANIIDYNMIIVLVGKLQNRYKLPGNIINIKETQNVKELVAYYSMSDVYVHLSREETFGKTIIEALSCGTPAIVFNSTACPELVSEGVGYIVDDFDIRSVYNSIKKVETNQKSFYSHKAILSVKDKFNSSENINEIINLYCDLIN